MTSLIKKSLNNIVLSFLKIPIWKEKFGVYWRFLRPETSLSTILAGLGGIFYGCKTTEECIIFESILAVIGVTLAHLSVNALNEIQDYKSGLDRETLKTPFSGGTKILVEGKISLTEAFVLATLTFIVALSIGLYLSALYGLVLLLFVIAGALIILLYDPYLLRLGLGEFGAFMRSVLVFLGCAYVATKELHTSAIFLGATYGALSTITLYINHLADVKVDIKYGRRTLPILLKEKVWIGYFLVLMIFVLSLLLSTIKEIVSPLVALLTLLPIPYALRILKSLKEGNEEIMKILSENAHFSRSALLLLTTALIVETFVERATTS